MSKKSLVYMAPIHLLGRLYKQLLKTIAEDPVRDGKKNLILYTGKIFGHMVDAIEQYEKQKKLPLRIGLIYDEKQKLDEYTEHVLDRLDLVIKCDTKSSSAIQKALLPYQNQILAVTCRSEDQIPLLSRVLPNVPYINHPTTESLAWASDKILMRERLSNFDTSISPKYVVVQDDTKKTLDRLEKEVGFPMIVKPSGLRASQLVTICFHKEELKETLTKVFKKITSIYKEYEGNWEPQVLVEQFIEGSMYSIDAYVSPDGKVYFCPMVNIKTGKTIGFDDFFGYRQMTPTQLKDETVGQAKKVAAKAIIALGLASTSAHVELMRTEDGWKVIEVGPRVGGFRHMLYEFSYDINHTMNDVLVRIGDKPTISKKQLGFSVAMKFFAKEEGKLTKLTGIKKAQELRSFKQIYIHKKIGDSCAYAKHGGKSVFDIIMFNKDRSKLLADIRRLEQMIDIETE
jgi:biotin carboxylase